MTFEEKLQEYAELIIHMGINLRPGQTLYLTCPIERADFCHRVVKEAYEAGAKEVIVKWEDDYVKRLYYENAADECFDRVYPWMAEERNTLAKSDTAFLHLIGSDPEAFKGVDNSKMKRERLAVFEACKEYYHMQSTMGFKWNIVAVPTKAWAKRVFPVLSAEAAQEKLWEAIFTCVRVGNGNSMEAWLHHAEDLKKRTKILNEWNLSELHYENGIGTDFTVGLVDENIWEGGADKDPVDGRPFFANMPTEEVFTMPHRDRAEGTLVSAMPLSYNGALIENFSLTFRNGKVVDFSAKSGAETLKTLLESDEGSTHLGECALVPYPSPVSKTGILFLETLFDENAVCHFALGACYETNVKGGAAMTEEEILSVGGNQSANHVDFMIGTKDLHITGRKADGTSVEIFRNGTWAF